MPRLPDRNPHRPQGAERGGYAPFVRLLFPDRRAHGAPEQEALLAREHARRQPVQARPPRHLVRGVQQLQGLRRVPRHAGDVGRVTDHDRLQALRPDARRVEHVDVGQRLIVREHGPLVVAGGVEHVAASGAQRGHGAVGVGALPVPVAREHRAAAARRYYAVQDDHGARRVRRLQRSGLDYDGVERGVRRPVPAPRQGQQSE